MNQRKSSNSRVVYSHQCIPPCTQNQKLSFCQLCGIFMDLKNPKNTFHRSKKFSGAFYTTEGNQVLAQMLTKQGNNRIFNSNPPHLEFREALIAYVFKLGTKLDYKKKTLHLAVAIIDQVFSQCNVKKQEITLVAIVSLIIAAKMEEQDCKIPLIQDIIDKLHGQFTKSQFLYCERIILQQILKFNANIITPFQFASQFLFRGILNGKEINYGLIDEQLSNELVKFFEEIVFAFIDFSLQHYEFYHFTSAAVAASALACARKIFGLEEIWSENLENLVGYSWQSIEKCSNLMIQLFALDEQENLEKMFSIRCTYQQRIQEAFFSLQSPITSKNQQITNASSVSALPVFTYSEDNFFIEENEKEKVLKGLEQDNYQLDQQEIQKSSCYESNSWSEESTQDPLLRSNSQIDNLQKKHKLKSSNQSDSLHQGIIDPQQLNKTKFFNKIQILS